MQTPFNFTHKLMAQWRSQILAHRQQTRVDARRNFAAVSVLVNGHPHLPFVRIKYLLIAVMYEDDFHSENGPLSQRAPLRFSLYRVTRTSHGVHWGGAANSILFKDLTLFPQYGALRQRVDRSNLQLIELALRLDRWLSRAARCPGLPRRVLLLPRLWAGFRRFDVDRLRPEGPEFQQLCNETGMTEDVLFRNSARMLNGLVLYPLDWVSNQLEYAATVFAEMAGLRRQQVIRLDQFPDGLVGFRGASAFDFYHSRFRRLSIAPRADSDNEIDPAQVTLPTGDHVTAGSLAKTG